MEDNCDELDAFDGRGCGKTMPPEAIAKRIKRAEKALKKQQEAEAYLAPVVNEYYNQLLSGITTNNIWSFHPKTLEQLSKLKKP